MGVMLISGECRYLCLCGVHSPAAGLPTADVNCFRPPAHALNVDTKARISGTSPKQERILRPKTKHHWPVPRIVYVLGRHHAFHIHTQHDWYRASRSSIQHCRDRRCEPWPSASISCAQLDRSRVARWHGGFNLLHAGMTNGAGHGLTNTVGG